MDSTIHLDKKEWEAFLKKLSELEKKYQLVLHELDEAHSKLQALDNPREAKEEKAQPSMGPAKEQPAQKTEPKKLSFLASLEAKLRSSRNRPPGRKLIGSGAQLNYASCSRCGSKIAHAARFCDRCGADFGGWVCSCGRGLSESVRFCDRCGRKVEDDIQPTS